MNRSVSFAVVVIMLVACTPPKPKVPALTPSLAAELLHYNNKAQTWMTYVKKNNSGCEYRLDLPDQTSQPASIDLNHIVVCNGRPSPKEFDASVSFEYDKAAQRWMLTRFAS